MPRNETTEPIAAAPLPPARHPYAAFGLRAGFGVALVAILLWYYDARPILALMVREDPAYFAATVALYVAGQVMSAYRWKLLAALVQVRGAYSEFLAYYFVGMFTNLFVPGLVGGDATRSLYLGRRHGRVGEAVASVVADRGFGIIALFWFAGAAALLFGRGVLAPSVTIAAVIAGAAAVALYACGPLIARAIRFAPRRLGRAAGLLTPYLHRPFATLPAIILSLILQGSIAVGQWWLALGLGLDVPLSVFLLCVPLANVFASLPITLNGLGVREAAYLVLFGMAGLGREDAIALGLLWFAATMLGGLTGAVAFVMTDLPKALPADGEGN
jgi:uncharacterized membrane protein YbhN (UPF0104 family)